MSAVPVYRKSLLDGRMRARGFGAAPFLLTLLYIVSTPLDGVLFKYGIEWVGTLIAAVMIFLMLMLAGLNGLSRRMLLGVPVLLLLGWSGVTILWSMDPSVGLYYFAQQVYLVVPMLFVLAFPMNKARYRASLVALSLALCLAVVFGLYYQFSAAEPMRYRGRLTVSEDYNPSWLAAQVGLVVLLTIILWGWEKRKFPRLFWAMVGLVTFIALLMTQGKNALLSLVLAVFMMVGLRLLKLKIPKGYLRILWLVVLAAGGFVILAIQFPELIAYDRILLLASSDMVQATSGRSAIWADYFIILKSPLWSPLGRGIWSATNIYEMAFGHPKAPHNAFISILVDLGIPGLVLYLLIFFTLARSVFRLRGALGQGARVLLGYTFLLSFGNDMLVYKYFWLGLVVTVIVASWAVCETAPSMSTEQRASIEIFGAD